MKIKKIIFSLVLFISLILLCNICSAKDLDFIKDYTITVDPRNDGSLNMNYHIEWEVLDSTSAGPLTWVKIGIPNANVDTIQAISSNIKSIKYYKMNGDYVRIDFKNSYQEGDIVSFDFQIHQSFMYDIDSKGATYSFTPGWFDDVKVGQITILWNADKVKSSTCSEINSDNYLVWSKSLRKGEKLTAKVIYDSRAFNFNYDKQNIAATITQPYSNSNSNSNYAVIFIFFIVLVVVLSSAFSNTGYRSHGGYGYYNSDPGLGYIRHRNRTSSYDRSIRSSSSHSSCVSSCACACACAGGGRAGCSKKDFYGTKISTQKLNKILKSK